MAFYSFEVLDVVAELAESGMPEAVVREALDPLGLEIVAFDSDLAYSTGLLRPLTKGLGLSLGDRACLALARSLGLPAITTDRTWAKLDIGVTIRVIR
ncbi:MAG: PIN domain-containing protein [Chloroflexota bacterium]|jgi:ribonuclease VapC